MVTIMMEYNSRSSSGDDSNDNCVVERDDDK